MGKLLKKRYFACILMVLTVLLSVGFNSYNRLTALHNLTEASFSEQQDTNNKSVKSVQGYLDDISSTSNKIVNLSKAYLPSSTASVVKVSKAVGNLTSATSPSGKYVANSNLFEAVGQLYYDLKHEDSLTTSDAEKLTAYNNIINNDNEKLIDVATTYNNGVKSYNDKVSTFPFNMLKFVKGFQPLECFN